MNRLIIIGAGGHGKVIADIAMKNGYTDIAFLDDHVKSGSVGFKLLGTTRDAVAFNDGITDFVIGIGNNKIRKMIAEKYPELNYVVLIHPSAVLGYRVQIGRGTVVMAGAVINPCSRIGEHCIVNTASVIEHDDVLGNYVHISPKAALGGTVYVGEGVQIGIGASVRNNVSICGNCTFGAGAAVVKDVTEAGVYIGVPAERVSATE